MFLLRIIKMDCFLFCLLAMVLFAVPGHARNNTITWLESDLAPCFIHEGPYKDLGYEDIITDILEEHLNGYEFRMQKANIPRMYREFKAGNNVCHVAFYKNPEREKFMYFSVPNTITFPVVLVMKADNLGRFKDRDVLSLEEMLEDEGMKLAIAEGRSYGAPLDSVLEKYNHKENVYSYTKSTISKRNFNMLMSDRIDYALALPEEVMLWAGKNNVRDKLRIFHLKENQGNYHNWYGYVACPRTEWGKKVIQKINRVLLEQRTTERYRKAYERWIDDKSIPRYRRLYDKYFLNTGK